MSGRQMSPEEVIDQLDKMERRLNQSENRAVETVRRVNDLEDEVEALEAENETLRETVESQEQAIAELERQRTRLARRLHTVEGEVGIDEDDAYAIADGKEHNPLRLLERVGPEAVADTPTVKLRRARVLVENRDRWGEVRTTPAFGRHRVLATRQHDLKQRLEDARDEDLQWNQVYAAMEKVVSLGPANLTLEDSYGSEENWGKALVWTEVSEA